MHRTPYFDVSARATARAFREGALVGDEGVSRTDSPALIAFSCGWATIVMKRRRNSPVHRLVRTLERTSVARKIGALRRERISKRSAGLGGVGMRWLISCRPLSRTTSQAATRTNLCVSSPSLTMNDHGVDPTSSFRSALVAGMFQTRVAAYSGETC